MNALAVHDTPTTPATLLQPVPVSISNRISNLETQMAELTGKFGEMQESLKDIGLSVGTLIDDLKCRTAE